MARRLRITLLLAAVLAAPGTLDDPNRERDDRDSCRAEEGALIGPVCVEAEDVGHDIAGVSLIEGSCVCAAG